MRRRTYLQTVVAAVIAGATIDTADPVQAAQTEAITVWTREAKLLASDGDRCENFGSTVAVDGDTAIVGAPDDGDPNGPRAGSADVFERVGEGWTQRTKVAAADGQRDDQFGTAVAVDGDTAIVGAPAPEAVTSTGAAYVFERSDGSWSQEAKMKSDKQAAQSFGSRVALAGDTALVSAPTDNNENGLGAGAAYVFERRGGDWSREAKLTANEGEEFDALGFAVGLGTDVAVLGTAQPELWAAVFERAGGDWSQQTTLVPADVDEVDNGFGFSVAVDDGTALVGAFDGPYVFDRGDGEWSQEARLTPEDGEADGQFGLFVALDGGRALVSAPREENVGGDTIGSVYVFERTDVDWSQQTRVAAADSIGCDLFGRALELAEDTALVGAPRVDTSDGESAGAAYVFGATEWEGLTRYADVDGVVRSDGLQMAIGDWRAGDIDTAVLQEVIRAWRSGDPLVDS